MEVKEVKLVKGREEGGWTVFICSIPLGAILTRYPVNTSTTRS